MVAGLLAPGIPDSAQKSLLYLDQLDCFRIWDAHSHLEALRGSTPEQRMQILVRHMDKLGVERLLLSQGFAEFIFHPTRNKYAKKTIE